MINQFSNISNISVYIWAKAPFQSYLLGQYDTGLSDRSWFIGTDQANETRMRVVLSSTGAYSSTTSKDYLTTSNVFDNTWHMYGFDWNAGYLRLDVDGVPQAVTKNFDAAFTSIFGSSSDISVGARIINNLPSEYYTGEVGEYYVFGRSTSPVESLNLYNKTKKFYGR